MTIRPLSVAIGGLISLAAVMGIGRFVYTPILPYMVDALSLTKSEAGLIAAANYLGYLLGALAGATGLVGGNRRHWMLWGIAVSAATTAAMAATTSPYLFMAFRFTGGLASSLFMVFGSALIFERLAAAKRPDLSYVFFAGVGVGIAGSAALVAALGAAGFGWDGQWVATGGLAIAGIAAVAWLIPPAPGDTPAPPPPGGSRTDRRMIPLSVAYGLFGFGYVITTTFISAIVRQTPEIAHIEPYIWIVVGLGALPSVAFWSWIGRRTGNPIAFALACLVEATGVTITVLVADPAAVLVAAVMVGGTFVCITAVGLFIATDLASSYGADPRRMIALVTGIFGIGQMVGPAFAGYVADITGTFTAPSLIAAGALVIGAGLAMTLRMGK
jgi:predicted MFS family arabinose efflux permease